jgi:hypothetical protein
MSRRYEGVLRDKCGRPTNVIHFSLRPLHVPLQDFRRAVTGRCTAALHAPQNMQNGVNLRLTCFSMTLSSGH